MTCLHGDHLGSASLTTDATGSILSQARYKPFGGTRYDTGVATDLQFTGQRRETSIGLYDYGARFYDPLIGRFVSADTIVPGAGNPQALNRYAYGLNNPIKFIDPSGHDPECAADNSRCWEEQYNNARGLFWEDGLWVPGAPRFATPAMLILAATLNPQLLQAAGAHIAFDLNTDVMVGSASQYARLLLGRTQEGIITDLEAFARLSDFTAFISGNKSDYMRTMSWVINGFNGGGIGRIGASVFGYAPEMVGDNEVSGWKDSGFSFLFQDGGNQIQHAWLAVQIGYWQGDNPLTQLAVMWHEIPNLLGNGGASWQDWLLSRAGLPLGQQIADGTVNISAVGDSIRRNFSPASNR